MIDSLFDKKTTKKINSIAKKKSDIEREETKLSKEIMTKTSKETIYNVLDISEKFGHPNEQESSKSIRAKYDNKEELSLDDILTLKMLYASNYQYMNNRGDSTDA